MTSITRERRKKDVAQGDVVPFNGIGGAITNTHSSSQTVKVLAGVGLEAEFGTCADGAGNDISIVVDVGQRVVLPNAVIGATQLKFQGQSGPLRLEEST